MESANRAGRNARPVDWSEWRHAHDLKVWEAVALSLNVEPMMVRFQRDGWMAGPGRVIPDEGPEFDKRLRMAGRALDNGLELASIVMGEPARCGVFLAPFAAWVRDVVRWDAPAELIALAGPQTGRAVAARPKDDGPVVGAATWTDKRKAEARAMRERLQREGVKDYAAQTAAHFGVSTTRLREVLALDGMEPPKPAASPFPVHAFTARRK